MAEKKVKVRIKPLCNIGGIGNAGDVVWLTSAEAEEYAEYVEAATDTSPSPPTPLPLGEGSEVEDHSIMKPEVRRSGRVARKK